MLHETLRFQETNSAEFFTPRRRPAELGKSISGAGGLFQTRTVFPSLSPSEEALSLAAATVMATVLEAARTKWIALSY